MKGFEQEGPDDGAQPMTSDADQDDRARLIGEIVEAFVLGLGRDQAMTAECVVRITPAASSGRGQPGRSECDPRAILDAGNGGGVPGAVLSHRNFVCPRPHCQAAACGRENASGGYMSGRSS